MPVFDLREQDKVAFGGGGSFEVLLSQAQAESIYGGTQADGWYSVAYLAGGRYGEDINAGDECRDETGALLSPAPTTVSFFFENVVIDWADHTKALLDFLATTNVRGRYAMEYRNPAIDPQWLLMYLCTLENQNWEVTLGENEKRTRPFRLIAVQDGANPLYELKELPADGVTTPWDTAPYDDFANAATPV